MIINADKKDRCYVYSLKKYKPYDLAEKKQVLLLKATKITDIMSYANKVYISYKLR